jgi:hypothetical protein
MRSEWIVSDEVNGYGLIGIFESWIGFLSFMFSMTEV